VIGVSASQAGELRPLQAASIALGSMNGVAYYTAESDGFRVVATFADGEAGQPFRFAATLVDGQSILVSVPRGVDQPAHEVEIARIDDKLFVRPPTKKLAAVSD
jgi:hypothetical protein